MARKAREKSRTGMYNIILKGNTDIFKDDEDYNEFIERLENSPAEVLGLGLISRYAFMCLHESANGIASDLRTVVISYARYYNKKYNTDGKLFDGRFKSEPINSDGELKNSVSIIQSVTEITGKEACVTENDMAEYKMIPFYASAMGQKVKRQQPSAPKIDEKKEKNKKSLPSWLL